MNGRKARARRRALALLPTPRPSAGGAVRLGLHLRNEANLTSRCACGAQREVFEILPDGTLVPAATIEPGHGYYARFDHESDCPAVSPALERAFERGEISDPAGELFDRFRRRAT